MGDKVEVKSGGINALGLLGVAFVVLKLTGYISWSWWWVTAPFWGGLALILTILASVFIVACIVFSIGELIKKFSK